MFGRLLIRLIDWQRERLIDDPFPSYASLLGLGLVVACVALLVRGFV